MRLPSRQSAVIGAVALLGLALAVGLAVLASRLSTQHIGVAAESPDIGAHLVAPARATTTTTTATTPAKRHTIHHKRHSTPTRTKTVTVVVPATPVSPPPVVTRPVAPTPPVVVPAAPSTPPARNGSGDDSQGAAHGQADD